MSYLHLFSPDFRQRLTILATMIAILATNSTGSTNESSTPLPDTISYRLKAENMAFTVKPELHGEKPVLQVETKASPDPHQPGTLQFAEPRLLPFSPSIPPYVRVHTTSFSAKIFVENPNTIDTLRFVFEREEAPAKVLRVKPSTLTASQWNLVSLDDTTLGDMAHPLLTVRMEVTPASDKGTAFLIAAPQLKTTDGAIYSFLSSEVPRVTDGMVKPLASGPAKALPQRPTLTMGGYLVEQEDWAQDLPQMEKFMDEHFPEYDLILAPVWTPAPLLANRLTQLPPNIYFQFQKARFDNGYLHAIDGFPKNAESKPLNDFVNSVLATNPVIQNALKEDIDYAASLGVNLFKQVDYVWPWMGGRWGYDNFTQAAFTEDLLEKDEGLDLLPGPNGEKGGIIHFWDYYESYHGFRPSPRDLGLKSWDEYQPTSEAVASAGGPEAKRNLGVFVALFHYEWLRQAQRFGRWAIAQGGRHDFTLNPEDVCNGGDFVFLTRLKDVGVPYLEFFGGPAVLYSAYANLPLYVQAATTAGRKLGLITEVGQGGHGQNYLDPEIGYLYAYELSALGLMNYQSEWMEAPWRVMSDPANAYHYDRFAAWVSQAYGFAQAKREKTSRPLVKVYSTSFRSSVYYMQSWLWSLLQMDSFASLLADQQVDFQQTDQIFLPDVIKGADVLFYTFPASRTKDSHTVSEWLSTGGKTLVTHSYIPISVADGQSQLAAGVKNVEYRGENKNYSDFLTFNKSQDFALLPEFKKLQQQPSGQWLLPSDARSKVIAGTKKDPQITEISLPNRSRIVYVHSRPDSLSKERKAELASSLVQILNLPRLATVNSDAAAMVHRFSNPTSEVVVLWNREVLNSQGFFGGYGPHLLPDRGADAFDPKVRPYPYKSPGAKCSAKIPVSATGSYRVYRFLENRDERVEVGPEKEISLTVENAVVEQFYIAPDSPEFLEEISKLKEHRQKVAPFFMPAQQ